MRFLNISRFTSPSPLRLLDFAYLVVLLPLILIVKVPMLLYMLLVFLLLFFRKEPTKATLILIAFAALFALYLSLYGAFNFRGLSRLSLFVEMLIYLLIVAVSLQRLTRQINFYLIVSPVLLMALSLFFFHSVTMLIYVIVEIFVLLWLILSYRMQGSMQDTLRMAAMYFASSLPWVVLLFIFFPRISFEHASYGFRGDEIRRMGHDGTMYLDNKALLVPSDRVVMEVGFEGKVPSSDQLYFRGSMLYIDQKDHWEALSKAPAQLKRSDYESVDELMVYKVTLYPTRKRWLYLLDLPYEAPKGARIDADFVTTLKKDIEETQHYEATSALHYRYGRSTPPVILEAASHFDTGSNPKSFALAQKIKVQYPTMQRRVDAIVELFREQNLTYSLRPKPLDLNHSTDSFLLEEKVGYCVHFASSFVTFSRMAGVPARIVTGYKGDLKNSVENYLLVKERDAHAWAELLIDRAWKRVETTAFAVRVDDGTGQRTSQDGSKKKENSFLKQANLYLMYLKYQAETWIVEYSHFRQMQLLEKVKNRPGFFLKFLGTLLVMILLSIGALLYLRRPICTDSTLSALRPLLKALQKEGYVREEGETMHSFFYRYLDLNRQSMEIEMIDKLYEQIRYGGDSSRESEMMLQEAIRAFLTKR